MSEADPKITAHEVAGNRLTLLAEGPERLEALIALIDEAQTSLRLLYYIWCADEAGTRVRDALVRAAQRGVDVALLVDGFGAAGAKEGFFAPLADEGARFCRFVPRYGRRYLLRNHQKLALADSRRVIIGGFNISDDYFGLIEDGAWRDLGLLVEGDSVDCLVGYFEALFAWALRPEARMRELRRLLKQNSVTEGAMHWLFGGPTRRLSPWARAVRVDMKRASKLDIIAGYFSPGPVLMRRTGDVARHGDVRVITPAKTDHQASVGAARHTYWALLKRGARIFEYAATKLHTKLFVLDDVVHIGSANFDMRSLFLNLEMMLRVEDAAFAAAMRRYVDGEVANSTEITLEEHRKQRTLLNRLRWAIAYFVVAIADYRISQRLNFAGEKPLD
ncbi:MAG: phosphatidylserine/phosphatidylglycerophosphate/cardiolipin synthase family protein [Alphaproteobacteria bacterium]|nr:MAG: phosphatidylserine/phosphatidylglycerophosphate/cardiolipin synthase family protein [Alphaproteobacteria bacterium]